MATKSTTKEDVKKHQKLSDKDAETQAFKNAPQADPNYKPDQNTVTDNRKSDYEQPFLNNPESQAIHKDAFVEGYADDFPKENAPEEVPETDEEEPTEKEKAKSSKK